MVISTIISIVIVYVGVAFMQHRQKRAHRMLQGWAERYHFTVRYFEYRMFCAGPYAISNWLEYGIMVYYVELETEAGEQKTAFVRLGKGMLGLLNDHVGWQWA